jgi:hypothetical protein
MSITGLLGSDNKALNTLLVTFEALVFLALSVLFWAYLPSLLDRWFYGPAEQTIEGVKVVRSTAVWIYVLLAVLYLLAIAVWWSPSRSADEESEVRGFAVALAVALIVLGIWIENRYGALTTAGRQFAAVLKGKGVEDEPKLPETGSEESPAAPATPATAPQTAPDTPDDWEAEA